MVTTCSEIEVPVNDIPDFALVPVRHHLRARALFVPVNYGTDDRTPLGAQYEPDRKEVANFTGNRGPTNNTGLNVALAYPREAGLRFSLNF